MSVVSVVLATTAASLLAFTGPDLEDQPPGTEDNCAGMPSFEFVEPSDGAMLESPITVSYIEREACNCDTGGCYDNALSNSTLTANGASYPLTGEPIMLGLPAGEHELTLSGDADFHSESASITITIIGAGDSGPSGGAESSGSGSGCAIDQPGNAGGSVLALGLLVLVGLRRRS